MRRNKPEPRPFPEEWEAAYEWQLSARTRLEPGCEFKVTGQRGWFRFLKVIVGGLDASDVWVDGYADGHGHRSFDIGRVSKVRHNPARPKWRKA